MAAPESFVAWMSAHTANDKKHGRTVYRYHPRSDHHSKVLCELVLRDLLDGCPALASHARSGLVVGGSNVRHTFVGGTSNKSKAFDLAIGTPRSIETPPTAPLRIARAPIAKVRLSIEAKQCMTEHSKSTPRIFDELSSSHEIVHSGEPDAIACGLAVVNVASKYASPTRQLPTGNVLYTSHKQPKAVQAIVEHLRGLRRRTNIGAVGFDAFATIVIDCDNVGPCSLHESPPAPQPRDSDHYSTFISDISRIYSERFA